MIREPSLQLVQWAATFPLIQPLDPHGCGRFTITWFVRVFLAMLAGYDLASKPIPKKKAYSGRWHWR